ncbi:hypothetical protein AV530_019561 [Patagioenas fasciata monilis]|uniref:Uncharacterized protein n=1 Tax=Patagioenas fasciata monilis TaxID=372326 RepID=A0A1V4JEC7_PATFA|nr:hypothetical protein AV530_019561 [Patagioenas fasciata monilis]
MQKPEGKVHGALLTTSPGKRLGMKSAWRTCKVQSLRSPQCVMAVNIASSSEQLLSICSKSRARGGPWFASGKGGKICPLLHCHHLRSGGKESSLLSNILKASSQLFSTPHPGLRLKVKKEKE